MKQGLFFIYSLILIFILTSCLSSKKVTVMLKAYDSRIFEKRSDNLELPKGINLKVQNPLPDSSSVRKTYVMILPLVVINYFQANHQLTLGQSSLEIPAEELFKSELISHFNLLGWDNLYKNGYSLDIDVLEMGASGVFSSGGFILIAPGYGTGTGSSGDIAKCTRIQSKVHISFNLNHKDSLVAHSDFYFFAVANELGKVKVGYIGNNTKKRDFIPASLPDLVLGRSFEYLIPATKDIYKICIRSVSRDIVLRVRNSLSDFYSTTEQVRDKL